MQKETAVCGEEVCSGWGCGQMLGAGLIMGAGAPGEAIVSHPRSATKSFIEASGISTSGSPICAHPSFSLFPPSISPGGEAHIRRGMQPHLCDTWTAALGAAPARHGSTS